MKIHEGEETLLVEALNETFEFRINEGQLEQISTDVPTEVYDLLEQQTEHQVNRPDEPEVFENIRFEGPYQKTEGASVLGYNADDPKFENIGDLMKYGINVSVRVNPDGQTEIFAINSVELEEPIEV